MDRFVEAESTPVIRTDFSDQAAWLATVRETVARHGLFRANVRIMDDRSFDGVAREDIPARLPPGADHLFIFIVDSLTIAHPEHPLLVVDLYDAARPAFRAIPSEIGSIETNLSLANMDFREFAESADTDGIFRGF